MHSVSRTDTIIVYCFCVPLFCQLFDIPISPNDWGQHSLSCLCLTSISIYYIWSNCRLYLQQLIISSPKPFILLTECSTLSGRCYELQLARKLGFNYVKVLNMALSRWVWHGDVFQYYYLNLIRCLKETKDRQRHLGTGTQGNKHKAVLYLYQNP